MAVALFVALALVQVPLLLALAYHALLVLASLRSPAPCRAPNGPATRFAVAIPAHDEASVLPATLARLRHQAYPAELFDLHVVADHCTDATAEVAAQAGAIVHERRSPPKGRKSYALRWLLERLLAQQPAYDAVAVFDADSQVDPGFLAAMDCHLRAGGRALQGRHVIDNPQDGPFAALAAVDMRLNNRLRNQSRRNLGFACRLMGDAMAFDAGLLRAYGWQGDSIIEDREYGYELLLRGIRVRYVPEAISSGQAASSWKAGQPQRLRWYRGIGSIRRRLAGRLLAGALRARSLALLDGLLELVMPGYSWLAAVSALNLAAALALRLLSPATPAGPLGLTGSALLLAAWAAYPFLGLLVDRAPRWAFRALALGPLYLGWRLWISALVRLRGDRIAWVRTPRREERGKPGSGLKP